jgi:succinyl-CoA:acetate CoA-transferase
MSRVLNQEFRSKITTAEEAASYINHNDNVGVSGFTGSGYPKLVPQALSMRFARAQVEGQRFNIGLWSGASSAPEIDAALAMVDGIRLRLPYQSETVAATASTPAIWNMWTCTSAMCPSMSLTAFWASWMWPSSK